MCFVPVTGCFLCFYYLGFLFVYVLVGFRVFVL